MINVGVLQPNEGTSLDQKFKKSRHRVPLLETANLTGLAIVIDQVLFNGTAFAELTTNPLWLLVLTIVWRHGSGYGILAAGFSTIYYLYARGVVTEELNWLFVTPNHLVEPILWFVAAIILGELRRRDSQRLHALEARLDEMRGKHEESLKQLDALRTRSDALQAQLQAQIDVAQYALRVIRQIDQLTPDSITDWIVDVVVNVLNPGKFSVYLANLTGLHKQMVWGGDQDEALPDFYGSDTALYQKVVKEGRVLCIADESEVAIVENYGVLAGPLWTSGHGKVMGVIKFESLPFSRLNPQTVARLGIIGEWIGAAISELHERSIGAKAVSIGKKNSLGTDPPVDVIYGLQRQTGLDVSTIVFEPGKIDEENVAAVYESVNNAIDKALSELRSTDYLMAREEGLGCYTFVLPKTTQAQAQAISSRVQAVVAQHLPESLRDVPISAKVEPWPSIMGPSERRLQATAR